MSTEESPSTDLDLAAAALRADSADISAFVEALAERLELAVPGFVRVKRGRRGLRGPKLVTDISLSAGGDVLELHCDGGDLRAVRAKASGGIVLKTESVDIETWLTALAAAVATQAQRSERTRQALQQIVLDG